MSGTVRQRHGPVSPGRTNWVRPPSVEFSFDTTVVTSRDGHEQRSAIRQSARVAMTVEVLAWGAELHRLKADLFDDPLTRFFWPTAWRQTTLSVNTATSSSGTIEVSDVPFWLVAGCRVILRDGSSDQTALVTAVAGSVVTLDSAVSVDMLAGSKVYHAYLSPFEDETSFSALTGGVFTAAITASVTPGSDPQAIPALSLDQFEGYDIFPHKPNWRDQPRIKIGQTRETFDAGYGLIDQFSPTQYSYIDARYLFSSIGAAKAEEVIAFWLAQKGKRGQFRLPTFVQDFDIIGTVAAGSTTFRVRGHDFRAAYNNSDVYNVVAARWGDGTLEVRRIASMAEVGDHTEITLTAAWTEVVNSNTRMHWCPMARFGSDKLKVEWETAELADMTMTFKTLREDY